MSLAISLFGSVLMIKFSNWCGPALMVSDELRTWVVAGEQVIISVQGIDVTKLK